MAVVSPQRALVFSAIVKVCDVPVEIRIGLNRIEDRRIRWVALEEKPDRSASVSYFGSPWAIHSG